MLELLQYGFMQRALIAGVLVGIVGGYFGAFVVQRRLGFLAGGLAHAAFGGVALGILLGQEPLLVALPFTVATALGIRFVEERAPLSADSAIGVFFSLAMALGILFLALTPRYTTDAFAYLFGSILAVGNTELLASVALLAVCAATLPLWGRWAYATFDLEMARADRLATRRDGYLFYVCLALTIVLTVKIVGMVLAGAFLVIPAAAARLVSRRFATMTLLAVAIGAGSVVAGLWLSGTLDNLPSGAAIILVQAACFFLLLAIGRRV